MLSKTPPQEILLRFASVQGCYTLSYLLHPLQRLVAETNDKIQLSLTVYNTHELRMELLSYGPMVKVLAPPTLRDWLRMQHRTTARQA